MTRPDRAAGRGAPRADRSGYLAAVGPLLWPGAARGTERAGRPVREGRVLEDYLVLSDRRGPRLLLPASSAAASAGAVRRSSEPGSLAGRVTRQAVAGVVRTGLPRLVLPRYRVRATGDVGAGTLEDHVREVLGDVLFSVSISGAARANRKPVLQVLHRDGRTAAFVKVGINDLTARLVRDEHAALTLLQARRTELAGLEVPTPLHLGEWNGLTVLVQSSVCRPGRRAARDLPPAMAAARRLVDAFDVRRGPLAGSSYLASLRQRLAALADREVAGALEAVLTGLLAAADGLPLEFGAGHGDWTPWNMAHLPDRTCVWDWERFDLDVPVGFDAVHHALQSAAAGRGVAPSAAARACLSGGAALLAPLRVPARAAELVARLYLVDIAVRYCADGQGVAGAPLADVRHWLLPVLSHPSAPETRPPT